MSYTPTKWVDGETPIDAERLNNMESGIVAASKVQYIESLDEENLVNLRDLATGSYVMYGYFKPFSGAPNTLTFDNLLVNVVRKTAGSHVLVFSTLNSVVNFLEILVDDTSDTGFTYNRTDMKLLDLHALIEKVGDLDGLTTTEKSSLVASINEVVASTGSGESEFFTVVLSMGSSSDDFRADKTYDEIQEAYSAKKVVRLVYMGKEFAVHSKIANKLHFYPVALTSLSFMVFVVTSDDVWSYEYVDLSSESSGNVDYVGVEPDEDDIPKFFYGGALPQTKDDTIMPFRYISKTQDISGYCETKAQGTSSMSYAKKNQTTKFYKDSACTEKMKVDFKGWGEQRKFCFKANWIDISHARNIVSARLWGDVVKSRANYAELPELLRTSPNQGAIDGFPVKVYANGVYQGRYTLNIPKDGWMANMDDELDTHCILCGENYVSGCFRAAANINESDWSDELHDTVPASIKTRWNEVISFVMNSTDEEFRENLGQYFDVPSLIDYHLFGLASCGLDAYGKNQIYMTYDGQKWIATMYDMDSTWGLYWNGSKFVATDYARTSYEDYANGRQGNLLYIRLEQLFGAELQTRWNELKNGALSIENIFNRFERFTDIAQAELVKEDYASTTGGGKFTGIPSKDTNNIQQIRAFVLARQAWTNEYVANLSYVPCTGISLSASTLSFAAEGSQTLTATVTPEDCTEAIIWTSDNPNVATVSSGVVTALANGSATITVTCGGYSASCSVAVSGLVEPVPCTGITLDKSTLAFDSRNSKTLTATVTPSDTTDKVVWNSSNTAVATVENGVVTAVGNGSATITATCGNYSASCAVSVEVSNVESSFVTDTAYTVPLTEGLTLKQNGAIVEYTGESGSEVYFAIPTDADYVKFNAPGGTNYCFYDSNKVLIGSRDNVANKADNYVLAAMIPDGAAYIRFAILSVVSETKFLFSSFETVDNWSKSGNDYVTEIMPIPDGATVIGVANIGATTFDWLKIIIYDSTQSQLKVGGPNKGGAYAGNFDFSAYPTATSYKLSAYPNAETDNDPATQIGIWHDAPVT